MTSGQSIAVSVLFGFGLGLVSVAWADSASDACAALASARTALYSMINAKDKSSQDALNAKVQEASKVGLGACWYDWRQRQSGR
jgi:phage/plasmid primase-like uncharacterized protein